MRFFPVAAALMAFAPAAWAQSSSTITPMPPASTITPVAPAAPAAPPAAAPALPSEEAMKEARALAELLGVPNQVRNTITQVRNQVVQATIQASGKPVEDAIKIVDELLMPEFNARAGELQTALTIPWAQQFSIAELKDLRAFYTTPLGKKALTVLPGINQAAVQAGQQWSQRTFRESVQKHADELRGRGLKF